MNTSPILQIENVVAAYGRGSKRYQALSDVSLNVERGEIFGLLGPNGAGKTTLLSCIEALQQPEQGTIRVAGLPPQASKGKLGIQLQKGALLDNLTVSELIKLYAAMYNVFLSRNQLDELLHRFGLLEQRAKYIRQLSGGQQQRVAIAIAVANQPEIVLLDEPSAALDPQGRRVVWELIRQMHEEGRTVVITTHSMEEAEALCGRVAIIDQGRIITCGTPAAIIASLGLGTTLKATVDLALEQVQGLPGVRGARYSGQHLELQTDAPQSTMAALSELALRSGRAIADLSLRQPNLEDAFLKLTGRAYAVS